MLSIGRIGAGSGYRYLTDQVATQDAPRTGENLHAYYQRSGYPPGTWVGAQADTFGLDGPVDIEAMGRLFGQLAHPVTGESLGRKPAEYRTLAQRVTARVDRLDHPTDGEPGRDRGRGGVCSDPQPVAGFDLTFSAPKSLSVLWALSGPRSATPCEPPTRPPGGTPWPCSRPGGRHPPRGGRDRPSRRGRNHRSRLRALVLAGPATPSYTPMWPCPPWSPRATDGGGGWTRGPCTGPPPPYRSATGPP